jgi:predicted membrane-bound dolichyl-phosphate-mannose-protein mannosyltransferase
MNSGSLGESQEVTKTYPGLRFWFLFLAGLSLLDLLLTLVLVTVHGASPASVQPADLTPFVYLLAGASAASTVLGVLWLLLRYPARRKVVVILLAITLGIMAAHLYTINSPPTSQCLDSTSGVQGCVMDEIYYVPAAQALLSGEKCGPYIDNCNLEHPFLSKAFIAAGIELFGNNDFGWRFFEGLLGTLCVPILFGICWKFTKDTTLSLLAAFLLAFETLFFVQSSIAVIDVYMIFFGLLAFLVYIADVHYWKLDKYMISGVLMGLSVLSKEMGVFMVAFLLFYNLVFGAGSPRARSLSTLTMLVIAVVVFCGGLQVYVSLLGNSSTTTFVADIQYILKYGASLKVGPGGGGWSIWAGSGPPYITPFTWFLYYLPISYDVIRVTVTSGATSYTYVSVGYFGAPELFETWFVYIWIPYVVYLAYKGWKGRQATANRSPVSSSYDGPPTTMSTLGPGHSFSPWSASSGVLGSVSPGSPSGAPTAGSSEAAGDNSEGVQLTLEGTPLVTPEAGETSAYQLAKFAAIWFAFTYLPYVLLFLYGRVTYPYYVLSADPALAIGMAWVMTRKWFPSEVRYILLGGVVAWFIVFYPDQSFLPVWLRVLLGH